MADRTESSSLVAQRAEERIQRQAHIEIALNVLKEWGVDVSSDTVDFFKKTPWYARLEAEIHPPKLVFFEYPRRGDAFSFEDHLTYFGRRVELEHVGYRNVKVRVGWDDGRGQDFRDLFNIEAGENSIVMQGLLEISKSGDELILVGHSTNGLGHTDSRTALGFFFHLNSRQ